MRAFLTLQGVLLTFILIRSADQAISAALRRAVVSALLYGIVAVLALLVVLFSFIGIP